MNNGQVNIIGKGMGWQLAPLNGKSWGINDLILRRDVDRVVDVHDYNYDCSEEEIGWMKQARRRAEEIGAEYIDVDNYPIKEIVEEFQTNYFNCGIDYMIALAIYEGHSQIDMYGVTMEHHTEYGYQRAGVSYWIGLARGRGITVNVHGIRATLLKTETGLMYGYGCLQQL